MSRFFLSAAFASRSPKAVFNREHQVHCRAFLEVSTFTVAGFRDSDSILNLSALLIPSQCYWQALCFCCICYLCFGADYRTPEDWMLLDSEPDTCSFQAPKMKWFCLFFPCAKLEKYICFFWGGGLTPLHTGRNTTASPSCPKLLKK